MQLGSDIKYLKGVGPKMSEELNKCGIFTVLDLLLYFPRDYEIINYNKGIKECEVNEKVIIESTVQRILPDVRTKTGKRLTTILFNDGETNFKGKWFNQPYVRKSFRVGGKYMISGKTQKFGNEVILSNPKILRNITFDNNKITSKYPLRGKLTHNFLNKIISQLLFEVDIKENFPKWIIDKYKFSSLKDSIINIHSPQNVRELNEAKRRLKFQELFTYSLKILMLKEYVHKNDKGIAFKMDTELKVLKEKLPFSLTKAQSRVVREILLDEKRGKPMNRLVQGDVGSGKTIVAIIAMFNVVKNGYQVAMMAPTEILAQQHFVEVNKVLQDFNFNVKLLAGSTTKKNKEIIKQELKEGKIDILVGTHALIEDNVEFQNLGMVVTDEQHRFGVNQRCRISGKGNNIDVLVMTATPIPRTLALYLYGDLQVSIIDELPPGRKVIDTRYVNKNSKDKVYNFAVKEINKGRQVYIVCPLVEHNEELKLSSVEEVHAELKEKYFKDIDIEILHGKMKPKEKEAIMSRFKNGEIKAVVSTTVIEVGVNVPNATLMIIENAERFGLAQLHQLRGRVGRGEYKSYCILIADIKSNVTRKRMEIMAKSNDGFFIAEEDLKIRGSGELFGFRQSGETELILADVIEDIDLLKLANTEAKKMIHSENQEDIKVKEEILEKIQNTSNYICFN